MTQRRDQAEVCQSLDRTTLDLVELDDAPRVPSRGVNASVLTPGRRGAGRVTDGGTAAPVRGGRLRARGCPGDGRVALHGRRAQGAPTAQRHDGGVAPPPAGWRPQQDGHDAVVAALTPDGAGVAVDEHGGSPSLCPRPTPRTLGGP